MGLRDSDDYTNYYEKRLYVENEKLKKENTRLRDKIKEISALVDLVQEKLKEI